MAQHQYFLITMTLFQEISKTITTQALAVKTKQIQDVC